MKKTVLITGASSGFGKITVKLFHDRGWNVIATMRSPEKSSDFTTMENVLVEKMDVTDKGQIGAAVKAGIERFGRIDVLVNNAGYGSLGTLEGASDGEIRRQFDVNFFGVVDVIKAVLPTMRAQKEGVIINVSSVGGRITFPFSTLYHSTKFAVEGLTESLQYEVNPLGIRTKLVEPGGYKTDFVSRSMSFYGTAGITDYEVPLGKFGAMLDHWPLNENIEEVGETIFLAATDGSEKLRYPIGHDAAQTLEARGKMDDVEFKKMMASQTGVA